VCHRTLVVREDARAQVEKVWDAKMIAGACAVCPRHDVPAAQGENVASDGTATTLEELIAKNRPRS
jgi:hypothetical protein